MLRKAKRYEIVDLDEKIATAVIIGEEEGPAELEVEENSLKR